MTTHGISRSTSGTPTTTERPPVDYGRPTTAKAMVRRVQSQEFFEDWKAGKTRLEIPEEVWRRARESGTEDRLAQIEAWMEALNDIMARSDLTDAEKKGFVARFFNSYDNDVDDAAAGSIGYLIAAVMGRDDDLLDSMILDPDSGTGDDVLDADALVEMDRVFGETIQGVNQQFGIQRQPDREALNRWNAEVEVNKKRLAERERDRLSLEATSSTLGPLRP